MDEIPARLRGRAAGGNMAVLINMAVVTTMAMVKRIVMMPMSLAPSPRRGQQAEDLAAQLFSAHGWKVKRALAVGPYKADLLIRKGRRVFVVEVKAFSEGRPDRIVPLLSHAILQAQAYALPLKAKPMAVIYVREASPSLISQVGLFSKDFASDVAVGIISEDGVEYFSGEGLEELNVDPNRVRRSLARSPAPVARLFSDLNQWMLKVLLAPEIPEPMLRAPRGRYRNVSELAKAARVSMMSAFRFHRQLRAEGFLDESSGHINLVRRPELFRRWQVDAHRYLSRELPMRFLIRGHIDKQVRQFASNHDRCVALFAAADALKLGHVSGVPPYIYVRKLSPRPLRDWNDLVPIAAGERPDLIVRQAPAPESIFRGMADEDGLGFCDVLQVWLDVSAHPARGEEQAALIYRKVLKPVVEGPPSERP